MAHPIALQARLRLGAAASDERTPEERDVTGSSRSAAPATRPPRNRVRESGAHISMPVAVIPNSRFQNVYVLREGVLIARTNDLAA